MNKYYLEILKKIEESGFQAYIVGGFVRDKLLGNTSEDIDIITNATPKQMKKIFGNIVKTYDKYGAIKLNYCNNVFDITTFRREISYKNGKPSKIKYINDLEADLKRRDFRINAICMNKDEKIIDLLGGTEDLKKGIIKTIRNAKIEFDEDPTRILRALRFMCKYNFKLDEEIIEYITKYPSKLKEINIIKRKEELDRIFESNNVNKFLKFIKDYNLENTLGIKSNNFKETNTILGVWSELEIIDEYKFTKSEKNNITEIKKLLKKGKIEKIDLYQKGLYICSIAGDILGLDKKELNLIYTNLPIKGIIDIDIKNDEICSILKIKPSKKLGIILKILEKEIIEGTLINKKEEIVKRLYELR